MIVDLSGVTNSEIDALGSELDGLDFSRSERVAFLKATYSCDVQAAPGSGKTTLLAAKLELIGRRLQGDHRGVAVVSHTNVARDEIEARLAPRAGGSLMLRYPHFVGTLTRFTHDHIALPIMRGMGWPVRVIDDERHNKQATALLCRSGAAGWLSNQGRPPKPQLYAEKVRAGAVKIVGDLRLDPDERLQLRPLGNLRDRSMPTFLALQTAKDELIQAGVFSYADALAVALYGLRICPAVAASVARRFPLVILDEAQDTGTEALAILDEIQKAGSTLQRLGDVNQSIYSFDGGAAAWQPRNRVIELPETRRFGAMIADFASRIGPYRAQAITPPPKGTDALLIIEYETGSETEVVKRFVAATRSLLEGPLGPIWAVGHRMKRTAGNDRQIVIPNYCPGVDALDDRSSAPSSRSLIAAVRTARLTGPNGTLAPEASAALASAVAQVLEHACILTDRNWREGGWRSLKKFGRDYPEGARALRTWMSDMLSGTSPTDDRDVWKAAVGRLRSVLETLPGRATAVELADYLSYEDARPIDAKSVSDRVAVEVEGEWLDVRIGTVASVKGQTHDATLVLDTDYRQMKAVQKALQRALAVHSTGKSPGVEEAMLLANVYVGATRPRRLLGLALAKGALTPADRNSALARGWQIVEVCRPSSGLGATVFSSPLPT